MNRKLNCKIKTQNKNYLYLFTQYYCLCPVSFFSSSFLLICIFLKVPINGKFPHAPAPWRRCGGNGRGGVFSVEQSQLVLLCVGLHVSSCRSSHECCVGPPYPVQLSDPGACEVTYPTRFLSLPLPPPQLSWISCIMSTFSLLAL